jgi:hypothetical protein
MIKILRTTNEPGVYTFYCPGCECHHQIWTSEAKGKSFCWTWNGSIESPTFRASLLVQYHKWTPPVTSENHEEWKKNPWEQKQVEHICHSYITEGKIEYLSDCTHDLKGQTIEMHNALE